MKKKQARLPRLRPGGELTSRRDTRNTGEENSLPIAATSSRNGGFLERRARGGEIRVIEQRESENLKFFFDRRRNPESLRRLHLLSQLSLARLSRLSLSPPIFQSRQRGRSAFPQAHGRPLRRPPRRRRRRRRRSMMIIAANAAAATDHPSSSCDSPGGVVVGEGVARGGEHCAAAAAAASPAPAGRQRRDAQHAPARGHPPRPQVGYGNSSSRRRRGRGERRVRRRVEERDPPPARRHRQQFPVAPAAAATAAAALEEARAHRRRGRRAALERLFPFFSFLDRPAPADPHRPRVDDGDAARPRPRDSDAAAVAGPAAGGRRGPRVRPGRGEGEEGRIEGGGGAGASFSPGLAQGPEAQAAVGTRGCDDGAAASRLSSRRGGGERGAEDVGGCPARR